jgi:hypothetical protein
MARLSLTPEQRKVLSPTPVFTVSQASFEVKHRFIALQRLIFTLTILTGIAAMWIIAFLPASHSPFLRWSFFIGGLAFLFVVNRLRTQKLQFISFVLQILCFAAFIGTLVPQGQRQILLLCAPTILVGLVMLGYTFNTFVCKHKLTPWKEYLLVGPWLVVAMVLTYLLPAPEWVFALSGVVTLALLFCMNLAPLYSLALYRTSEVFASAACIIPLVCISGFQQRYTK